MIHFGAMAELRTSDQPHDFKLFASPVLGKAGENYLEQFESGEVPIFQVITEDEHICFYAHRSPTGIKRPHFFVNQLNSYIRAIQIHLQKEGWLPLDGTTTEYLPHRTENVEPV